MCVWLTSMMWAGGVNLHGILIYLLIVHVAYLYKISQPNFSHCSCSENHMYHWAKMEGAENCTGLLVKKMKYKKKSVDLR